MARKRPSDCRMMPVVDAISTMPSPSATIQLSHVCAASAGPDQARNCKASVADTAGATSPQQMHSRTIWSTAPMRSIRIPAR